MPVAKIIIFILYQRQRLVLSFAFSLRYFSGLLHSTHSRFITLLTRRRR